MSDSRQPSVRDLLRSSGVSPELIDRAMRDPELLRLLQEDLRRKVQGSFTAWCTEALAPLGQSPARHHRLICDRIEHTVRTPNSRLMLMAPPGSAKSTYSTILGPPWMLRYEPRANVMSASHTTELAETFGRRVRNTVAEWADLLGYNLSEDSRAAGRWETTLGGGYIAVGVGSAIPGRRVDVGIIDDPVSGREAADSQKDRDRIWNWYRGDFYGRLRPGGRIILIMTRWHEDDLAGRLLQEMHTGGDQWEILSLPALAETRDEFVDPKTGQLYPRITDPLGRLSGEALWPEWESAEMLDRKRSVVGPREWASQYQQHPVAGEGVIFRRERFVYVRDITSRIVSEVRRWDLAATADTGTRDPDWTVGVRMARLEDGRMVVRDVRRIRGSPQEVEALIVSTARSDGESVVIGLPQDPGQAGKAQVSYLTTKLAGYVVSSSPETGSKATRAMPLAAQVEAGNVLLVDSHWCRSFVDELASFPAGAKDDQVDAASGAFNMLYESSTAERFIEYYRGMIARRAIEASRPANENRQARPEVDRTVIDAYRSASALARGMSRRSHSFCAYCHEEIVGTRVTDGVDSWHPDHMGLRRAVDQ